MADDVWTALVKGTLAFAHSRAGDLVGDSFNDTGSLVKSLFDNSPPGTAKTRLEQLKTDIGALSDAVKPLVEAVKPEAKKAADAVSKMATELGTSPFTMEAAARAATELGYVLIALDAAIDIIAKEIAKPEPTEDARKQMEAAIRGIKAPWIKPFENLATDLHKTFDTLCKSVLGVDDAGKKFAAELAWSRDQKRLALRLEKADSRSIGPLSFDGASVEAFFSYLDKAKIGIAVKANLKAGLRGDKFLEKIIPGQGATADSSSTTITLDSLDGLTFGEGPNKKLVLPVRVSSPGFEVREMSIARPPGPKEGSGRIDVMVTIAGKLGDALAVVAEEGGISLFYQDGGSIDVKPKPPTGAGMRVKAGPVTGGGYVRYKEDVKEYGGVLDLKLTEFGITAIGLIGTEPFSLVIVIGVHFLPKIELSFGFTLNGVGGLLAIERRLDSAELRKGMKDGAIGMLLFPNDPVASAPKILDQLAKVFPPQPGAFVIGPMIELGWGSQAGFMKARVGIVIALPDPKIVVLGAVEIGVPSANIDPKLRIVDLRAEILGEFTPDYLLILISLNNSKLATFPISGDIGLFIRWSGGSAFALSVGGFFPKYTPPPELAGMRRIAVEISPPVKWIKVNAEAYFAITSNTVQFGGKVVVVADLAVVSAKAWLQLDALFQWSPRFYFIIIIDAGIEVKAFGVTVAGVSFHGELSGTTPWRLEGKATVEILWWDVSVDIGPIEWGKRDTTSAPSISPAGEAAAALTLDEAWKPKLPAGTEMLAYLREDSSPLLVHPLGQLEIKQLRVPLETPIDRIGSRPVTSRQAYIKDPKVGSLDLQSVSHAKELFSPGHFIKMTDDQQASRPDFESFPCGLQVAASASTRHEVNPGSIQYAWETVFPHEETLKPRRELFDLIKVSSAIKFNRFALRAGAVASAARDRGNPYISRPVEMVDGVALRDVGVVSVTRMSDSSKVAGAPVGVATALAGQWLADTTSEATDLQLIAEGVLV